MLTRGELKGQVLRLLNKTSSFTGFYTDAKVNDAIQEAYDFVAVEMFQANEGWLTQIQYFDTAPGQVTVPIPGSISMIREVRYKHGDVWVPMVYDDGTDQASYGDLGDRSTQYPIIYRIVDNKFYFDPHLAEGGSRYLQVESTNYPAWLLNDMDQIEPQFGRACMHFMKYKVASVLAASLEKPFIPWAQQESQWFQKMLITVNKRINKPIRIREFGD